MTSLTEAERLQIHAWRQRLVCLWLITMSAALLVWAASAAFVVSQSIQTALGIVLLALLIIIAVTMRRGKCPRCGQRIKFAVRVELPPACSRCGVSFYSERSQEPR